LSSKFEAGSVSKVWKISRTQFLICIVLGNIEWKVRRSQEIKWSSIPVVQIFL
jgi:hypothetical protein